MESRVPRPCRYGGCRVLTTEGYCEEHKLMANKNRLSSSARGYGYKWRKASRLLSQLVENEDNKKNESAAVSASAPVEMLTIKECAEAVTGLSEHTIRQLVAQEKIPYIRIGKGKRGKILISKAALWGYLESQH